MAKRTGAVIRLTDDRAQARCAVRACAAARRTSRPATARHYTNLYFRYNRPGAAQAAHGSCLARGRLAGARVEQPGRNLSAGMQARIMP
ncbi:hypothetical protein BCCH1_54700 [Burkholderia contaminans]|uniref:Uncharacterized protein n=1 Tax=Burkholderia contaminans TaxID=488447 RepID=A0A250LEK5_9BURK|nr:hypothetical protein BCCH1_54700 [Burkholderia contaminans]GLZ72804.1 hypothetical protein Bcon01_58490 [Burkholderia contaminans]